MSAPESLARTAVRAAAPETVLAVPCRRVDLRSPGEYAEDHLPYQFEQFKNGELAELMVTAWNPATRIFGVAAPSG